MTQQDTRLHIVSSYERLLQQHGDTAAGVGWTQPTQVELRYQVMLDLVRMDHLRGDDTQSIDLLDFGSGAAHFYEYLLAHGDIPIRYTGLDLSEQYIELSRQKHPDVHFIHLDVMSTDETLPVFDYVVLNGVLTWKNQASHEEMWAYSQRLLTVALGMARKGIAFNVMSTHLDWERDDLFHVPFDRMATFVRAELSPHFLFRQDYGLYEYTTYVYRDAHDSHR